MPRFRRPTPPMTLTRALAIIRRIDAEERPERGLRRFLPRDVDDCLTREGLDIRNMKNEEDGSTRLRRFEIYTLKTGAVRWRL